MVFYCFVGLVTFCKGLVGLGTPLVGFCKGLVGLVMFSKDLVGLGTPLVGFCTHERREANCVLLSELVS